MLFICNMLLVTVVLFRKSQLYLTLSLPVALHVKVNSRPSIIVLFAGARVITGVSRSNVQSRQVQLVLQVLFIPLLSSMLYDSIKNISFTSVYKSVSKYWTLSTN